MGMQVPRRQHVSRLPKLHAVFMLRLYMCHPYAYMFTLEPDHILASAGDSASWPYYRNRYVLQVVVLVNDKRYIIAES